MEIEEPVKQGLLLFPPQGVLSQLKKAWHKRYCQLFKASKSGIARLEIWDCKEDFLNKQSSPRIITLEACIKIGLSSQAKVFEVVTKTNDYHFGCFTETETCDWIAVFQQVAFKDDTSNEIIEEENDLYCASNEGVFSVKLVETEASKRCRLDLKNYTLVISAMDLKLIDNDTVLFTWPYRYIRKYGYRDGKFTFEAGRKCVSGEGSFKLEHSNQQEIFRCISSRMKCMKKLLKNNELEQGSLSLGIDCNDAQYQAALTMEAGSRSPLPLSSNFSSVNVVEDDISVSQNSQKPLIFYSYLPTSTSNSVPLIRPPPVIKPKPTKPPRKYVDSNLINEKLVDTEFQNTSDSVKYKKLNYSSSSKFDSTYAQLESKNDETNSYDIVEVRNNAWKTHGIDIIPHNENRDSNYSLSELNSEQINSAMKNLHIARKIKSTKEDQSNSDNHYNNNNNETDEDVGIDCENLNDEEKDIHIQYETIITESSNSLTNASVSTLNYNLFPILETPADYDKLQHIGSLYKGNSNSGYKTPTGASNSLENSLSCYNSSAVSVEKSIPSWNDYDVVEDIFVDSSSRGYGVIRKKTSQPEPKHRVYNNSEYAIVSKPKRV